MLLQKHVKIFLIQTLPCCCHGCCVTDQLAETSGVSTPSCMDVREFTQHLTTSSVCLCVCLLLLQVILMLLCGCLAFPDVAATNLQIWELTPVRWGNQENLLAHWWLAYMTNEDVSMHDHNNLHTLQDVFLCAQTQNGYVKCQRDCEGAGFVGSFSRHGSSYSAEPVPLNHKCCHAAWQQAARSDGKKIEFWKQNNINMIIFTAGESHYKRENNHLRVFDMIVDK